MSARGFLVLVILIATIGWTTANPPPSHDAGYIIVHTFPHDSGAFTQGLVYVDGHLYESTGLYGRSSIRKVDVSTGRVVQKYDLPPQYFGEGLTDWNGTLIQLT